MSSGRRQIVRVDFGALSRAATLVMALFVVSRVLGLVRQMVIGVLFDTSGDLDAYLAAARVPEMIFMVVAGGALGSAFILTFTDHLAKEDRAGAWRLASAVVNLALIALTVTAGLMAGSAPALVRAFIAPGFAPPQQALTARLLQLMLVYPSLHEGFGLPPLEAMACGTPVVANNTTSLPEAVGQAALTVDPTNTEEMAAAMARLLDEPSLRQDLRQAGIERAREFTWRRTAQ